MVELRESDRGRNEQFTTLVNASIRDLNTHLEAQFKSYLDELREIDRRRDEQFTALVNAISALSNGPPPPCVVSRIGLKLFILVGSLYYLFWIYFV